jgi:hypothetical protein
MLKLDILIVRNLEMAHDQFLAYWRDRHAALFSSQPIVKKTVRRYLQSRILSKPPLAYFSPHSTGSRRSGSTTSKAFSNMYNPQTTTT